MNQEKNFSLEASCVQLDVAASDWQEAIQKTCGPLLEGGYVKNGYSNDVIAREKQWATGLPTMPVGVAIPHALMLTALLEAKTPLDFSYIFNAKEQLGKENRTW